jgi:hypothetical protein
LRAADGITPLSKSGNERLFETTILWIRPSTKNLKIYSLDPDIQFCDSKDEDSCREIKEDSHALVKRDDLSVDEKG